MLNSSFIQGFERDDCHPLAPLHSNSLVLPAMLAAAALQVRRRLLDTPAQRQNGLTR
jgi:2-methylcitrate dehydratase PrpD